MSGKLIIVWEVKEKSIMDFFFIEFFSGIFLTYVIDAHAMCCFLAEHLFPSTLHEAEYP